MPIITAFIPHPRRAGRVEVMVDGKSLGAVPVDALSRLGLTIGADFAPLAGAFEREREALATWDRASGLLATRARSRTELRRSLLRKGEPASSVDPVLDRLESAGYLNDGEFARQFARSKMLGTGMSRRRVQQELGKRGVARDVADAAIDVVFVDEQVNEAEAVERLARKKLQSLSRYDEATRRRRLYGYLARRGFESEDIREVMGRIGAEPGEEGDR